MAQYENGCSDLGFVIANDVVELVDDDLTERAQHISRGFGHKHLHFGGETKETQLDTLLLETHSQAYLGITMFCFLFCLENALLLLHMVPLHDYSLAGEMLCVVVTMSEACSQKMLNDFTLNVVTIHITGCGLACWLMNTTYKAAKVFEPSPVDTLLALVLIHDVVASPFIVENTVVGPEQ